MLGGRDPAGSGGALEIAQRAWRRLAGLFVAGHLPEGKHVVCAPWDAHGGIFLPTLDREAPREEATIIGSGFFIRILKSPSPLNDANQLTNEINHSSFLSLRILDESLANPYVKNFF